MYPLFELKGLAQGNVVRGALDGRERLGRNQGRIKERDDVAQLASTIKDVVDLSPLDVGPDLPRRLRITVKGISGSHERGDRGAVGLGVKVSCDDGRQLFGKVIYKVDEVVGLRRSGGLVLPAGFQMDCRKGNVPTRAGGKTSGEQGHDNAKDERQIKERT